VTAVGRGLLWGEKRKSWEKWWGFCGHVRVEGRGRTSWGAEGCGGHRCVSFVPHSIALVVRVNVEVHFTQVLVSRVVGHHHRGAIEVTIVVDVHLREPPNLLIQIRHPAHPIVSVGEWPSRALPPPAPHTHALASSPRSSLATATQDGAGCFGGGAHLSQFLSCFAIDCKAQSCEGSLLLPAEVVVGEHLRQLVLVLLDLLAELGLILLNVALLVLELVGRTLKVVQLLPRVV
jgi:hypothetical protein